MWMDLYNNQMIACTLIGQSSVVLLSSKLMDILHVFWIIILYVYWNNTTK